MISKGIVLVLVAGLILGGGATYLAYDYYSNDYIEFPLSLDDPSGDLIFVSSQTWNGRGRPNGTMADDSEFSQYFDHVDFLNLMLNQTQSGFNISMQWADDIIISEGVIYAIYIELTNVSYIVTYTEGNLICASDTPERNIDWHDYYYIDNSTFVSEFSVSGPYINLTLDLDIEPLDISYILAISGIGEFEYYMDFIELEIRLEEDTGDGIPSNFDEIYIRGDTDFTKDNGVSRGKGTANDPYIIENITVNGVFNLEKTSKYVEIKDVIITGNGYMGMNGENIKIVNLIINTSSEYSIDPNHHYNMGLSIRAGSNIRVYGVDIQTQNLSDGICIGWAKDVLISNANINGAKTGIDMFGPENVIVEYSTISNTTYAAFDIQNSKNVIIRNTTISNNTGYSVFTASTSDTLTIEHCDIIDNNQGLGLSCESCKVIYCNLINNYLGVRLGHDSTNLIITNNNFVDNQAHLYWQASLDTRPTDAVIFNNYWSETLIPFSSGDTNPSSDIIENAGPM